MDYALAEQLAELKVVLDSVLAGSLTPQRHICLAEDPLRDPYSIYCFMAPYVVDQPQEQFWVLAFDTKLCLQAKVMVYQGTVNSIAIRASEVFREPIIRNLPNIIVVHNHPSGDPTPSAQDISTTSILMGASKILDIHLLDHIIIGRDKFYSMKSKGHM